MPQEILQNVLQGSELEENLFKWILGDVTDNILTDTYTCTKTEFIIYFLNFIRNQTNRFLKISEDSNTAGDSLNNGDNVEFNKSEDKSNSHRGISNESLIKFQERNISIGQARFSNNSNIDSVFNENAFSPVPHSDGLRSNDSSTSFHFSTPTDQKKKNNFPSGRSHTKFQKSNERISINFGDYVQNFSNKKKTQFHNRSKNLSNEISDITCSSDSTTHGSSNLKDTVFSPEDKSIIDFPVLGQRQSTHNNSSSRANRSRRIKPTSLNFSENDSDKNKSIRNCFNEMSEKHQNGILCNSFQTERSILKNEKDFIKMQFQNTKIMKPIYINPKEKQTVLKVLDPGDISKVTNKRKLDILANIYTVILNNNLHTNYISEMSFVFSLLNVEESETLLDESDVFGSFNNCIYFCIKILEEQKKFFILLDSDTLKVLCDNKRIQAYSSYLCKFLKSILKQKNNSYSLIDNCISNKNNVCFQSETDNRENFTSDQTFRAFRKQRDLFYDILRNWESCHNTPNYSFAIYDVTIMTLFNVNGLLMPNKVQQKKYSEQTEFGRINILYNNVCNMAHFARLFVKQLLASCETEHTEFNQLVMESLPNVDPNRLSRLSNRFVTNATTTSDITTFTGVQEFYRDFIQYCDNHTFLEHLKIVMCNEILDTNAACIDYKNIDVLIMNVEEGVNEDDKPKKTLVDDDLQKSLDLIKKISSLRLLAKFLGFTTDLPYNNNGYKMKALTFSALNKIEINPILDLNSILNNCTDTFTQLLVLLWITMYLAMLNEETLLTPNYKRLIEKLFEIYTKSSILDEYKDSTIFLKYCLKIILGNFFDLPNVSINFYDWRYSIPLKELNQNYVNNCYYNGKYIQNFEIDKELSISNKLQSETVPLGISFLEKVLYQNLPFLSSLKSVIKGFKTYNKGRIRHVTPFTHHTNTKDKDDRKIQVQLENQFFNNHPSSVKKTVEFVTDRIFSVIVKELVAKDISQAKSSVNRKCCDIKSIKTSEIETQVTLICTETLKELLTQCNSTIEKLCKERISTTISNLLPIEMLDAVKSTCVKICTQKVMLKCQTWLKENAANIKAVCKDIDALVQQIAKNNVNNNMVNNSIKDNSLQVSDNLDTSEFLSDDTGPSEILIELQDILCNIITEEYSAETLKLKLKSILNRIEHCITVWTMFLNLYIKNLASLTIDVAIALVCHYPKCLQEILPKLYIIWKKDVFCAFIKAEGKNVDLPEISQDLTEKIEIDDENVLNTDDNIFLKVISERTVVLLSESEKLEEVWNSYRQLVTGLIIENCLTIDCFGEASLKLLRSEWSNVTLNQLSQCIKNVMAKYQEVKSVDCSEITLLLDWMAEFCEDIDL